MESKQTAVEWYENEMDTLIEKYESKEISKSDFIVMRHNLFYSAKEIEKERSLDAFFAGFNYEGGHPIDQHEEFYKKTYNS
jgi:hypothetical protein